MTREEFELRYAAMPEVGKAELIEGVVYMASPVGINHHGKPHSALNSWLGVYWMLTPGVMVGDNSTVRLDEDNEPQPDILMRIERGGRSRITSDDYLEGPPELAVEIAGSSASYDLHDKKRAYERNGVQEYIVWNSTARKIVWFSLQSGRYVEIEPNEAGILQSLVFPGLWLNAAAFERNDLRSVYDTLQSGIADEAHQAFVQEIARR